MFQPTEAATAGGKRLLRLSDGWLVECGLMSSLLVGPGPTTPGRHETSICDAVRGGYTHSQYEFKAFVAVGPKIPGIGPPTRTSGVHPVGKPVGCCGHPVHRNPLQHRPRYLVSGGEEPRVNGGLTLLGGIAVGMMAGLEGRSDAAWDGRLGRRCS